VRAVEQGLSLIRAANTGISAIVDPWGRILSEMPVGDEGVIDALLPSATAPTVYHRFGIPLLFLLYRATIVGTLYPLWRV